MIIWAGRREPNKNDAGLRVGITAHRWVLETGKWFISLQRQYECEGEWKSGHGDHFSINVISEWQWGSEHLYYDGPNCSFALGRICFNWRYWWCDKCAKNGGVADL